MAQISANYSGCYRPTMASNTRFAVALHVTAILAWNDAPISSSRLAFSVGTNPAVVRRVLGWLADAGIVESKRGRDGGTELARSPSEITLLEIYEATEQANLLGRHTPNPRCPFVRRTRRGFEELLHQVESTLEDELADLTLADGLAKMGVRVS